jgi:hypothetical protein
MAWSNELSASKSCLISFFTFLTIYVITMYPDLAGGDVGELTAAAVLGGVPHPPGYPLYAMLGNYFVHLSPFGGSPARQLNIISCIFGAGAAALLHWSILSRTKFVETVSSLSAWTGERARINFCFEVY